MELNDFEVPKDHRLAFCRIISRCLKLLFDTANGDNKLETHLLVMNNTLNGIIQILKVENDKRLIQRQRSAGEGGMMKEVYILNMIRIIEIAINSIVDVLDGNDSNAMPYLKIADNAISGLKQLIETRSDE